MLDNNRCIICVPMCANVCQWQIFVVILAAAVPVNSGIIIAVRYVLGYYIYSVL